MIYLDHAATTPVDPAVLDAMLPFFTESYGNPNSVHAIGRDARAGVDWARGTIANILNCRPREIVFTSGATESNNLAIKGTAWWRRLHSQNNGNHIVSTAIEHHAVLHAVESLARHGFEFTFVRPDGSGIVDPDAIRDAIRPDTCLVSVMYANNEIGTIQPVEQIARIAHEHDIVFHCDAVQAAGSLPLDVEALGIDLLSLSAHKFYAPKGVGLLYVRDGTNVEWLQHGGGQEHTRRAGTENVPGIVGMAAGLALATEQREQRNAHAAALRDRLAEALLEQVPDSGINGHRSSRLPNNLNISFAGVDAESILLDLDLNNIAVSSGSACASGSDQPSHVLLALGLPVELAEGSLRLTVGKDNTTEEIDETVNVIARAIERVRQISGSTFE